MPIYTHLRTHNKVHRFQADKPYSTTCLLQKKFTLAIKCFCYITLKSGAIQIILYYHVSLSNHHIEANDIYNLVYFRIRFRRPSG